MRSVGFAAMKGPMPPPPTFEARLASARLLSDSVRELVFERADGEAVAFTAGQWVTLVLPIAPGPDAPATDRAHPELRRSYSIASPPGPSARFELAVTRVDGGPGSSFLHAMKPGDALRVVGPQGFFTRPRERSGPSLFIATGTGVTPLRSMLRAALSEGETRPLWLLLGGRAEPDLLYRDEFDALARLHPNVRAFYTLSRAPDEWAGLRGYVQTHARGLWSELQRADCGAPHAYICGLQRMVGATRDLLRNELAAEREQVHSERYD